MPTDPPKKFTVASVRALKLTPNPGERYERFEPGGLGVRVGNRNKAFIFLYRYHGKARRMTLGRFPEMSLADAHVELANAKKLLSEGIDPGTKAVEQRRIERMAETVAALAELYVNLHARPKKRSWRDDERMLENDVLPAIGHLKAKEVTRRDVVAMLDRITERAPITSNRVHSLVRRLFFFGIRRDIVTWNPAIGIERNEELPRERTLTDDEIKLLWTADLPLTWVMRRALMFALVTGTRRNSVAAAEWAEINDEGIWELPASKTKAGQPHVLPLPQLALDLLEENDLPWLFPSPRRDGPISGDSMTNGFRHAMASVGVNGVVVHDLRRTCATRMAQRGITPFIIRRVLGHNEPGVLARHYNKYDYLHEKAEAVKTWADYLKEIVSGEPAPGKIVELAERRT